jgi:hypothetical protein
MKTCLAFITFLVLCLIGAGSTLAEGGYPSWRDHAFPLDFTFGNHIDTHQQTRLSENGDLFGFFYITFTGDAAFNLPVAEHCYENTPPDKCVVGWILRGKPHQTTFLFHHDDHPVWLMDSRADIPQPGGYSHFHWLDRPEMPDGLIPETRFDGYILELQAVRSFAFMHGGEIIPVKPGVDVATHVNIVTSFP